MSDTQTIKERLDIVDFISEYIPLKQAGSNLKARCPFHQEKTPSFMVSRERQMWHCFGCNKGGDVFAFTQEMEGLSFPEALRLLADKAGVALTQHAPGGDTANANRRNRILDLLQFACAWYHRGLLRSPRAGDARAYLEQRGVTAALIERFEIGYVPDEWRLLTQALFAAGYGIEECAAAGVSITRPDGGGYDRFRGRVMFPLHNVHGQVIGFTGRVLVETEKSGGKYVNTPQSPVYDKSAVVYGLHLAKQAIKQAGNVVVVEGQMDVIASHKAGVVNVVASSGTAFTLQQLILLKRYTGSLRVAFDQDAAGIAAAIRGVEAALELGFDVSVITLPEGAKDPDDCVQRNPQEWVGAARRAVPFMQFLIDNAIARAQGGSISQLRTHIAPALHLLRAIPSSIERGHWLSVLSDKTGIREEDIRAEIKVPRHGQKSAAGNEGRAVADPAGARYQTILALCLTSPAAAVALAHLPEEIIPSRFLELHHAFLLYYRNEVAPHPNAAIAFNAERLSEDNAHLFYAVQLLAESLEVTAAEAPRQAFMLATALRSRWLTRVRDELIARLKAAESSGNTEEIQQLLSRLEELKS